MTATYINVVFVVIYLSGAVQFCVNQSTISMIISQSSGMNLQTCFVAPCMTVEFWWACLIMITCTYSVFTPVILGSTGSEETTSTDITVVATGKAVGVGVGVAIGAAIMVVGAIILIIVVIATIYKRKPPKMCTAIVTPTSEEIK